MSKSKHSSAYRNVLSLKKRVQVIKEYESCYPRPRITVLANKFNACSSQIRNIIFNQEAILKAYKEEEEKDKNDSVETASVKSKKYSSDKKETEHQQNPESGEDSNSRMLSVSDRLKVVHDYYYKIPKPTISSLATEYCVSPHHISNVLFSQESKIQSKKDVGHGVYTDEETMVNRQNQRRFQIQFLGIVMYEYLERVLYHNEPIDYRKFQKKATEVKECIAINKFKLSNLWVNGFKKKYGLDDLNLESLRKIIILTDEKPYSLDAVDMVRYVRQHKSDLLKSESDLINRLTNSTQTKTFGFSGNNGDNEMLKPETDSSDTDVNGSPNSIELSPKQLSENSAPHHAEEDLLPVLSTSKNQKVLKTVEQNSEKRYINCLTVVGRKSTAGTDINVNDLSQNIVKSVTSPHLSEEEDFMKMFQIVYDEVPTSPAPDSDTCSSPSLSNVKYDSQKTDIKTNTDDDITIKTETLSNDDQLMGAKVNNISTYNLPEDVIAKRKVNPKPRTVLKTSEGIVIVNNNGTNSHQRSPRLAVNEKPYFISNLPEVLEEGNKPTFVFERSEDFAILNNNATNGHQRSTRLATRLNSPLPDIDTLEEAMKHLKVLENYVMLKENFRAIGLITQLEEAMTNPPKL